MTQRKRDIETLQLGLQRYGADPARWPEDLRALLNDASPDDADVQGLIAEARALDSVLEAGNGDVAAGKLDQKEAALATRIMAVVEAEKAQTTKILPFRRKAGGPIGSPSSWQTRIEWNVAGGLLAASLMLGIFAGASGWIDSAADPVASAFGLSDDSIDVTDASSEIFGFSGLDDEWL